MYWSCLHEEGRLGTFEDVEAGVGEYERALECLFLFLNFLIFFKIVLFQREQVSRRRDRGRRGERESRRLP